MNLTTCHFERLVGMEANGRVFAMGWWLFSFASNPYKCLALQFAADLFVCQPFANTFVVRRFFVKLYG